jgi:hypothetical protein
MWWQYMSKAHENCGSAISEDCSRNIHKYLSMDYDKTMQCVRDSFSDSDWAKNTTHNSIIDEEIKYW